MVNGETGAVQYEIPAHVESLSVHFNIFLHQGSFDEHRYVVFLYVSGRECYHGHTTSVRGEFGQEEHPAETHECKVVVRSINYENQFIFKVINQCPTGELIGAFE